ncbi:MAG TPA: DUF1343 domain-containing protein, partial [Chitinophagaceae bacterium]|nr:DUF1343 domain-containing protein [Chitinophagaceae bacterium]
MLHKLHTVLFITCVTVALLPKQSACYCIRKPIGLPVESANTGPLHANATVRTGAENISEYIDILKGKRVAVFANQTSVVGHTHLVDTLMKLGVNIKVIFGPEHGFRGNADAGEKVENVVDPATGVPVISLYGKKRKPSAEDLKEVDIMLFDIQDVGVRFCTFISSLEDYLESAIENHKTVVILDRPNPNGFYVDGPVLEPAFRSFVGMQPVPVVYGMTIGEYGRMLVEEKWIPFLKAHPKVRLPAVFVIPCSNYTHKTLYELPIKPSPNLPEMQSIYWYPSTCFFEGTILSEGRGTDKPFQIFGHPSLPNNLYSFTPASREGAKAPKLMGKVCYGWNLSGSTEDVLKKVDGRIQLSYLLNAYKLFPDKDQFFLSSNFFNKLAGNATLMQQIKDGKTEQQIR